MSYTRRARKQLLRSLARLRAQKHRKSNLNCLFINKSCTRRGARKRAEVGTVHEFDVYTSSAGATAISYLLRKRSFKFASAIARGSTVVFVQCCCCAGSSTRPPCSSAAAHTWMRAVVTRNPQVLLPTGKSTPTAWPAPSVLDHSLLPSPARKKVHAKDLHEYVTLPCCHVYKLYI